VVVNVQEGERCGSEIGKLTVAGCGLMAPGTNRRRTFADTGDFDAFVTGTEAGMLVDEAPEMLTSV
jgi:hypothetical protein